MIDVSQLHPSAEQAMAFLTGGADVTGLLVGEVEDLWERVAIAQYPSRGPMLAMVQSPVYQAITKHRNAGRAGQLNISTKAAGA